MEAAIPTEGTDQPILPRADLSWIRLVVERAHTDLDALQGRMPEEAREDLARHLDAVRDGIGNLLDDGEDYDD